MTYNSCGTIKWNNGVSYPIQSGHGCIGCSEEGFWDQGSFYERMTGVPGLSEEKNADDIGKVAAGVLAGGIAVHAIAANISKRKELMGRINRGIENEKNIDS
jgi:hydrogenase small subunit